MPNPTNLLREYLEQKNVMQLATTTPEGQLWCCNLHYFSDDDLNLYWISTPTKIVLFDNKNFPDSPRQPIDLKEQSGQ